MVTLAFQVLKDTSFHTEQTMANKLVITGSEKSQRKFSGDSTLTFKNQINYNN